MTSIHTFTAVKRRRVFSLAIPARRAVAACVVAAVLASCSSSDSTAVDSTAPNSTSADDNNGVGSTDIAGSTPMGDTSSDAPMPDQKKAAADAEAEAAPVDEAGVIASMTTTIDSLPWPADHTVTAQGLWTSQLESAASDTTIDDTIATQAVEAWNVCAWTLEVSEAVAADDQERLDSSVEQMAGLASQYQTMPFAGDLYREVATEADQGSAAAADAFVEGNDCRSWPSA